MTARRDARGPNLTNLGGHSCGNESSESSRFCRGKRLIVKIRIDAKIHERKIMAASRAFLFYCSGSILVARFFYYTNRARELVFAVLLIAIIFRFVIVEFILTSANPIRMRAEICGQSRRRSPEESVVFALKQLCRQIWISSAVSRSLPQILQAKPPAEVPERRQL